MTCWTDVLEKQVPLFFPVLQLDNQIHSHPRTSFIISSPRTSDASLSKYPLGSPAYLALRATLFKKQG